MCNLVNKTGSKRGSKIIFNAEMIKKIQKTVDEVKREVQEGQRWKC